MDDIFYFAHPAGPGTQLITCEVSFICVDKNCPNFSNQNWDKNVTLCLFVALNHDATKINDVKLSKPYKKYFVEKNNYLTNIYVQYKCVCHMFIM